MPRARKPQAPVRCARACASATSWSRICDAPACATSSACRAIWCSDSSSASGAVAISRSSPSPTSRPSGFAADGYARSTRRLGVVCVTYGAGGHNVVNPIAGAYAEQVPLLVVSGGPGEAEQKLGGVHHQAKDGGRASGGSSRR